MVALSTRFAALALTLVVVDALPLPMNVEDAASGPSLFNAFHDHGDHHDKVVIVNGDHKHVEAKRSLVNIGGKPVDFLGDGLDICIGSRCTRDQPQTSYLRSRIVGRNALVSERQLETPLVHEGASSERHISSRIVGRRAVDDVKPRADPGSGDREDYARRDQSKRYLGLNGLDAHVDALPVAEAEVVLPRSWSRVMRPILGARSNAAAQSSRRSDDAPSGVSGTIALMTPNGSGANMTQVASLALGDPTAAKLVFDASAVNSTEVTLKAVSSDSLMAANIDMDSLSSSRIPVTLSVSAFDSSKAMMKDLCTTFDPAPSTPVKFELEDCFDGSNPAHKSQLFTYDSNTGELQPLWQTQPASDVSDEDDEDDEDDEKDSTDTQSQGGAVDPPTPKGGNLAVITDFAEDDYPVDASHPPMMAAAVMSRNGSTSSSSVGPKPSMASVAGTNGTTSSSSTNSSSASAASTNSTMQSSATNSNSTSNPAPNTVNGQSVVLIFKPVAGLSVSKASPVAAAAATTTTTSQTAQSGSAAAMPTVSMVGAARLSTSTVSTTSSSTTASASDNASGYELEMVPVSNSATPAATMKSRRDDQDPVLPLPPAATTAASSTMRKRMHARDLVASSDVMPLAASTSYSPTSSSASAPSPTMNRRHARDLTSSSPDSNSSVEEYAAQMLTVNLPPPSPTSAPPTSASPTPAPSTASSSSMVVTSSAMSEPTIFSSSMVVTPEPTISSSTVADTVTTTSSEPAATMEPPAGRRRSFRFSRNADV